MDSIKVLIKEVVTSIAGSESRKFAT